MNYSCPWCGKEHPLREYMTMRRPDARSHMGWLYRCPTCRLIFSTDLPLKEVAMLDMDLLRG